jgi:LacI family transcriptional regulator
VKKLAPSAPAVPARAKSGRPITSAELSRKLGLSPTTVSFVLNGLAEEKKIAAKTAARVLAAAKKYHYVPNPFARSLLKQRSEVIGVILGNFKMDYAEAVMQGMQGVFDNSSRIPFVAMHGFDAERNRKELLSSFARRDEGIIAFPLPGCDDVYRRIMDARVPLVLLGDVMPGLEYISSVTWDAEAAARVAVRHLLDTGRRRIAFLGVDYPGIGNLHRFKAYQAALHEAGLKVRRQWVATPRPMQQAEAMARTAIDGFFRPGAKDTPDAIFAINDGLALPALEDLRRLDLRVPEDVAVIGMQDLPLSGHPAIGLSTIREPVAEMAEQAARMVLDLIEGRASAPVHAVNSSAKLLIRRTTGG